MHQCKKIIILLIVSIVTVLLETTTVFATDTGVKTGTAVEPVLATKITKRSLTSRNDRNKVAQKKLTVFQKSVEVAENEKLVEAMEIMEPMEVMEPIEVVELMEIMEPVEIAETKETEELEFSTEDITKLTRLVFAESGNQEIEGQIAVAAVVINRKRNNNEFADTETIDDVILAEYAFTSITKVDFVKAKEEGCYNAVLKAVNEEDPTEELLWAEAIRLGLDPEVYAEGGALYFYNPDYCSEQALQDRANIKCKIEIGDHIFYKVWDK